MAAATYFMTRLLPYTVTTQDTAAWQAMSHNDCIFCASTVQRTAALRKQHRTAEIAPVRVVRTSSEVVGPAAFGVFLDIETGPDLTFADDGSLVRRDPVTSGRASVGVIHQGTSWIVLGVELVEDDSETS